MNKKKYTIQDIARELNTSISTVSRALRDHPRISAQMCEKVKKFAVEHDYQPDFRASSLRMGSNRTIGVLVPRVDINFLSKVIRGIDEVASTKDYNVMICQSYDSVDKEIKLVKSLLHGKVDGLIASISVETKNGDHFKSLINKGVPLVFFDKVVESIPVSKVLNDDHLGAYMSVEHLLNSGYKRIAHFGGPQFLNIHKSRTQGYRDALTDNGIQVDESLIFVDTLRHETGYSSMRKVFQMGKRPDAIFAASDYGLLGAITYAKQMGVAIPEEMGFSGFANESFDEIYDPPITSVDQRPLEMGQQAAELLIKTMQNKNSQNKIPEIIKIKPQLMVRKTTQRIKQVEHS